ncbi:hypothetical protein HJA76_09820 [Rhizobium bangladeshense]|uniref:hypothetical protein n=1 Tax=Rhizobium bangladeshense TaxID=1138189 RepID=UPI001C82C2BD|nr:hypothetical protein [Rhizobium bangladeshense]MBX4920005.1 hypothetical protein [Rhizobium bangladeshense]
MRKMIGVVCLVLAIAPGVRADDEPGTVGFMLKDYPASETTRPLMISAFRTLEAVNDHLEKIGADRISCRPVGSGTDESYEALMAYLQQHPELPKRPTNDLWDIYIEAMAKTFPCE